MDTEETKADDMEIGTCALIFLRDFEVLAFLDKKTIEILSGEVNLII